MAERASRKCTYSDLRIKLSFDEPTVTLKICLSIHPQKWVRVIYNQKCP